MSLPIMRYKVYIVYKITGAFTVGLVLKYASIMIRKTIVIYSKNQTKPRTWSPLAQYNSKLDKVKAHSSLPCRNRT